jgi:hypothetical protein
MVNYKVIVKDLQKKYSDANEVAIVSKEGKILFSTDNWDISNDFKRVLSDWEGGTAQFVSMDEIRYSILQMEPERLIATNRHNKGHLIGAASPDGTRCIIAHIKPKAKAWYHSAYPFVARAAAMMEKGVKSKSLEPKVRKKKSKTKMKQEETKVVLLDATGNQFNTYEKDYSVLKQVPQIDPYLKLEIENFLKWINDPNGLTSYISYYLEQNDHPRIQALAIIYKSLYRILTNE